MRHIAAKFTRNRVHLMQIYKTFMRSNLEFSSHVWHSSLTKENRQDLERVQKAALRVNLKSEYKDYEDALKLSRIQSLEERREQLSLRFVKKSLRNGTFSKLFPLKNAKHVIVMTLNLGSTTGVLNLLQTTFIQVLKNCKIT